MHDPAPVSPQAHEAPQSHQAHTAHGGAAASPRVTDWRHDGVRVIRGDQLDPNTAQTPGMNRAAAINAGGDIVGWSTDDRPGTMVSRAVIWPRGQRAVELQTGIPGTSGWFLQTASAVSGDGHVVGIGILGGKAHGFLLAPLP